MVTLFSILLTTACSPLSSNVSLLCTVATQTTSWSEQDETGQTLQMALYGRADLTGTLAWPEASVSAAPGALESFTMHLTPDLQASPVRRTVSDGDCASGVVLPIHVDWTSAQGQLQSRVRYDPELGVPTALLSEDGHLTYFVQANASQLRLSDSLLARVPDAYDWAFSFVGDERSGGTLGLSSTREDEEFGTQLRESQLDGIWMPMDAP